MNLSTQGNVMPRLIMFTPANTKSAIGRMAALVSRALSDAGCRLIVVRSESTHLLDSKTHNFGVPVVRWDDHARVRNYIDDSDACIYQIGDNYEFHQGGVHWLETHPGLVCLHDFFLANLFYMWGQERRHHANSILKAWYSEEASSRFFVHSSRESFIESTANSTPMTEWICSQAYAVITHSQWGADRVLQSCPGPVRVVPLAYDTGSSQTELGRRVSTPKSSKTLNLLTIGNINPNKRVESMISAIGSIPSLREQVHYRLVGAIEAEVATALDAMAKKLGVTLTISGEVDDTDLNTAINDADVISCLRWPALEAASASAIVAMLHGKAVIMTDTGFYKEIPDDCAIKISPYREIEDLKESLVSLLANRNSIDSIGAFATNWAKKTYTTTNYSQQLLEAIEQMKDAIPTICGSQFHGNQLQEWMTKQPFSTKSIHLQNLSIFK